MLRDSVATESIYGFAPEQANVPPEEPIFVLTATQLQAIISKAIQETTEPLIERIEALESWREDQATLVGSLTRIVKKEPTKDQQKKGLILRSLLATHNGKMFSRDARLIMNMEKAAFSRLLDVLSEYIESKPFHQDKRRLILSLKSC
jgi:hypothetical protein